MLVQCQLGLDQNILIWLWEQLVQVELYLLYKIFQHSMHKYTNLHWKMVKNVLTLFKVSISMLRKKLIVQKEKLFRQILRQKNWLGGNFCFIGSMLLFFSSNIQREFLFVLLLKANQLVRHLKWSKLLLKLFRQLTMVLTILVMRLTSCINLIITGKLRELEELGYTKVAQSLVISKLLARMLWGLLNSHLIFTKSGAQISLEKEVGLMLIEQTINLEDSP